MTEFKKVFLDTAPLIYFLDADIKLGELVKSIWSIHIAHKIMKK